MKKIFYFGLIGLLLFEFANIYFIMPMPGSQNMNSLDLAYSLYTWRWPIRIIFILAMLAGIKSVLQARYKWIPILSVFIVGAIIFLFNFKMAADHLFLQVNKIEHQFSNTNKIPNDRLVIGVAYQGEAKAYPIEFLTYHHQIIDSIGDKQIMVTYCSVCRTGRVFEPIVNGKIEQFRLVGMDHFNAMFEDQTTKSWWRQATGKAVTGILKGSQLPEFPSVQTTVQQWFSNYPNATVMQVDPNFKDSYDTLAKYEKGLSKGSLTRTDSLSWKDKSWVVGIEINSLSKAYDWNKLKNQNIINDTIQTVPIVIVMSSDKKTFMAFQRPSLALFTFNQDTLFNGTNKYNLWGQNITNSTDDLVKLNSYQEFWHSWKTFHPNTRVYQSSIDSILKIK
jgi:hypothetical protein